MIKRIFLYLTKVHLLNRFNYTLREVITTFVPSSLLLEGYSIEKVFIYEKRGQLREKKGTTLEQARARAYASLGLQEYPVEGLTIAEGIDLLVKRDVQAEEADLRKAVVYCRRRRTYVGWPKISRPRLVTLKSLL